MPDRLAVATGGRRSNMSGSDRVDAAGTGEPDGWVHPSMGVEEEFLLVDPSTGHPLPCSLAVVEAAEKLGVRLQLEFTQCQVETTSPVCWHTHELRTGLAEMRSAAADAAAQCGARLLAVGVPVLGSAVLPITDIRRFRTIASRFGYLARTRGVCAGHVHVGVPDRETAVQVGNYLRPWLPALLALTANSPIHRGVDTGFASWRSIMLSRWPCSGPPPWFASVEHYDAVVEEMVECGVILDEGMINWDVRPSAHLPTVEVRVSDVPATVDETVLLATVVRALVMTALRSISGGGCAPKITAEALRAGYSMAAREGLTGHGIDLTSDLVVPAPDLLGLLVCHVRSALEELGEYRAAVAMLTEVVGCGNGASRQRRALRIRNHVSDVIAMAAQSTLLVGRAAPSSGADVFSLPIPRDSPRVAVKSGLP
jgi:carboxylate-amine ligase